MDIRKKILLGSEDIISRTTQDFFLDINLSKDNREIIPYKYDNVFDLTKFYNQERKVSRKFVVYGVINSYVCDCNNLTINVYNSPNFSPSSFLTSTRTYDVVGSSLPFDNLYGKKKGRYAITKFTEKFTGCSIYLQIAKTGNPEIDNIISKNKFEQQLIFTTLTLMSDGRKVVEKLNYGLDEAVTDCDGNVIEVNNDFPFFYNKHWIKKDLEISNSQTKWIGGPNEPVCEMVQNPTYHGRTVYGMFNTGNYAYPETMEVYTINDLPTGVIETNSINKVSDISHYIQPVDSNGSCIKPEIYNLTFERQFLPNDLNIIKTASEAGLTDVHFYPIYPVGALFDNKLYETELCSGYTTNDSVNWTFQKFLIDGQETSPPGDVKFNFRIAHNTVVKAIYKEKCPWKLTSNISFSPCGTNFGAATYGISPLKNMYTNGESVTFTVPDSNYYIDSYSFNGINGSSASLSSDKRAISMVLHSDCTLNVTYKNYAIIKVETSNNYGTEGGGVEINGANYSNGEFIKSTCGQSWTLKFGYNPPDIQPASVNGYGDWCHEVFINGVFYEYSCGFYITPKTFTANDNYTIKVVFYWNYTDTSFG